MIRLSLSMSRDGVVGTDTYGTYVPKPTHLTSSFSIPYYSYIMSNVLLATGDESQYAVVSYEDLVNASSQATPQVISTSSSTGNGKIFNHQ